MLTDIRAHYNSPDNVPYPDESNAVVPTLSAFLSASGLQNPLRQIYCTVNAADDWGVLLFVFTITQLALYEYDDKISALVPRNRATTTTDAAALVLGVSTTLRQLHADQTASYLTSLGQYVRVRVASMNTETNAINAPMRMFDSTTRAAVAWMRHFARVADIPSKTLQAFLPRGVLSHAFA
uniref:Uncharacterized protein n=1 Tax=Ostreococcus mediterraneus TaxID=1486918 RepID=A0A7S2QZ27_9CHLO